jgi:hypothetical protein
MKHTRQALMTLAICSLVILSCEEITKPDDSLDKIVFPDSHVSYNRHVQPLFNIGCATTQCHDVETKASNLDLTDYQGIKQRFYDVVRPGDTSLSRLVWSVEGRPGSAPMPPQRSLNNNQIRGLKTWIMEGATDTIP